MFAHSQAYKQTTTTLNQLTIRCNDHQGILPFPEDSVGKSTLVFFVSIFYVTMDYGL